MMPFAISIEHALDAAVQALMTPQRAQNIADARRFMPGDFG